MTELIIIMYHLVVEKNIEFKNAPFNITKDKFIEQIDMMNKNYSIINYNEFKEIISNRSYKSKKTPVLLTFDDGTKDHYEIVTPILKKRNLSGIFFVSGKPVTEKKMLHAHAIHEILIRQPNKDEIIKIIDKFYQKNKLYDELNFFKKNWMVSDNFNDSKTRYIKKMLQVSLPEEEREKIISILFKKHVSKNERDFVEKFYATDEELNEMILNKMTLFPHGINHYHMDTLSDKELKKDIVDSISFIKRFNPKLDDWIACYPYGSFSNKVKTMCKKYKALCGFTVKCEKVILNENTDLMELPRINNDQIRNFL